MPTFYQRFRETARQFPDNIALEIQRQQTVERVTFSELAVMSESIGHWLSKHSTEHARVAILAANHPRWVAVYLGILASGRTAVPLDTALHAEQVKKLLIDSDSSILFVDGKHLIVAEEAAAGLNLSLVMMFELGDPPAKSESPDSKFAELDRILESRDAVFEPAIAANDDLAALLYTSGTTADPKGVMLTHGNLVEEANAVFSLIKIGPEDALLGILPMFHVLAQMANLFLPLFNGARVVYLETLNTTELLKALKERNITVFCVVPQFFYLIHERIFREISKRGKLFLRVARTLMALNYALRRLGLNAGKHLFGKIHATFGSRMRYLVTGGSRFDPAIAQDFYSIGIDVLNAYGLTETTGGAFINPPGDIVFGSVGKPLAGVETKIVDPKAEEPGSAASGEIAIRGAIVMKGYWKRPEATEEVLREGWLYTGDLGYFDSGGNLFITGRRKEMIVLANGKNVYPEEIEAHYLQAQYVKEMCVMALEARQGDPTSERLHAVIVPHFERLRERKIVNTKEAIRFEIEALSHKVASTKRLGSYDVWRDELPRTTTRKLKRFEIERLVRESRQDGTGHASLSNEKELTSEEQTWRQREDIRQALAVVRDFSRNDLREIRPSHSLELDLGLDSMRRIELLTALEQEFGGDVPETRLGELYTVRELVDAVLSSERRGGPPSQAATAPWSSILSEPVSDPDILALSRRNYFAETVLFPFSRLIKLFALDSFQLQIRGRENLPAKGPYLLCSNHQSYFDPLVLASTLPFRLFRHAFALGTSDIFGQGFMRKLARWVNVVVLDPDANLVPAMRAGAYGLRQGRILILYPEGERTNDGNPTTFRKGAAILSIHEQAPIVPIAIAGFYEAWPRHKKFPRITHLRLTFGEPIQPPARDQAGEAAYEQLTARLKEKVTGMWQEMENYKSRQGRFISSAGESDRRRS